MSLDEKLSRRRTAGRGWATRSSRALRTLLDVPDVTKVQLDDAVEDFDKRLAALDEAQGELELEISDPNLLQDDIEAADVFRREVREPRVLAAQMLVSFDKVEQLERQSAARSDSNSIESLSTRVNLPKIELPKFSGELTEWQSFWDRFEALVGETDIPVISKFTYLQSLLEGEAKSVILGLSLTAANYKVACTLLKERFGRKERIIFAHIQALLKVSMPARSAGDGDVASLWKLQDELLTHVRSLEALGVDGDQYGLFLTPVILGRLPHDIRLEWSREGSGHESDLRWLLQFLQKEIERRERSDTFKDVTTEKTTRDRSQPEAERRKVLPGSASALQTSSEVTSVRCGFCNNPHASERCYSVLKLSLPERKEKIRSALLCFHCLKRGHIGFGCSAICTRCGGFHNILVCPIGNDVDKGRSKGYGNQVARIRESEHLEKNSCERPVDLVGVAHSNPNYYKTNMKQTCTVLPTAKVKVFGERGMCAEATLLFDTGSDRSYVSSSFVRKIKPKWVSSEQISYSAFGGCKSTSGNPCNVYDMKLMDCNGSRHSLLTVEFPTICAPLLRPCVPVESIKAFDKVLLADDYVENRHLTVDILVGLDAYWRFMIPGSCVQAKGLVAQESVFGWVLSGSCTTPSNRMGMSSQLLCFSKLSESALHNFWDLESVGISLKEATSNDLSPNPVLERFSETVKFSNDRYEVALPWKSDNAKGKLLDNERLAKKRLLNLSHRFQKNPQLQQEYDAVLKGYEQEGIIEEVPPSEMVSLYPTYYLPHRPVVRESSATTKVRPVFDASAGSYNGISLNDCLEAGPSLNPDLVEVLMRFRRWPVALTGDITKAFLQISVQKEDRDVHRFLWESEGVVRTMRFLRVPFGNKSSPFLLNATVKHHLKTFPKLEVVEELTDNLYVDDWLSGADSDDECCAKFTEAKSILATAGMSLSKWSSNCKSLTDKLYENLEQGRDGIVKVLGMQWCLPLDYFAFECFDVGLHQDLVSTKRAVLSIIARLFDPLGLISPCIMLAKILFQDIWRLGLDWDETLPEDWLRKFKKWVEGLKVLQSFNIPRCYFPGFSWKLLTGLELHAFGDASEKGYGACVYLRIPSTYDYFDVSLVVSRGRVAPVKRISLPRLELLGALLCARLAVFVKSALRLADDVHLYCWTDSQVALSWIKGDPSRWKVFVANRVTEIQELTSPSQWHHCPGKDNPADLISRGVYAEDIVTCTLWLNGPTWLSNPLSPLQQDEASLLIHQEYSSESRDLICVAVDSIPVVIDFARWSHFSKTLHVVAWVMRFINNCKGRNIGCSGPLSYEELEKAKTLVYHCIQREKYFHEIRALTQGKPLPKGSPLRTLDPFLDDDGLLRVKGRLEHASISYESKHPIIIPSGHIAKLLICFQHDFLKHAGVNTLMTTLRSCYWIVGLRKLAKTVCRECITCRRHDSRACSQPVAPLPKLRVNCAPPFTVTGLDFAGPLFCMDLPSKKLYILLFTCAVVRAVHLELTDSLSQIDCMLAIRRFAARRGLPSVFYSDNAKTFVSVSNQIQKCFGPLVPQWKFIVPHAPWWGGWWERLIRSVKLALRKSLGVKCLSRCELETTLLEIEACINSRPLTYVGEETADQLLTPSHFLIGRTAGFQLEMINDQHLSVTSKDLKLHESVRQKQLDKFWDLWMTNYITNLPPTCKGFRPKCDLKPGSVVLVKEENTPRLSWPIGVIVDLFPGKDGVVRSVNVKTSRGVICRPVQKLYDMEIFPSGVVSADDLVPKNQSTNNGEPQVVTANEVAGDLGETQPVVQPTVQYSTWGRVVKAPVKLDL